MPNVQISDLPLATLPLTLTTTFFEVQTVEGGEDVSRKVAGDNLTFSAGVIQGTSTDDPSVAAGSFDGELIYQNANALQTASLRFASGDDFIIQNLAEGGDLQLQIRDGTVLVQTLPAASGGLQVNNTLTGAGLERVLTLSDIGGGSTVNAGTVEGQALRWDNAALEYDPTSTLLLNVADITSSLDFIIDKSDSQLILRSTNGDLTLFNDDPFAGSQQLVLAFAGDDILRANNAATAQTMLFSIGEATPGLTLTSGQADFEAGTVGDFILSGDCGSTTDVVSLELQTLGSAFSIDYDGTAQTITMRERNSDGGAVGSTYLQIDRTGAQLFLFQSNVSIARTVTAANGGLEVNNTSTGAGFERVLTTSDIGGVTFPLDALDNEQIRFGTGQDALFFFDGTDMQINLVDLADLRVLGGTAGAETMLSLIANGAMEASFDGTVRIATTADGENVFGTEVDLDNSSAATRAGFLARNSGGGMLIASSSAGNMEIAQTTSAGVVESSIIAATRDSDVALFFANIETARTAAVASGGFVIDQDYASGFNQVYTRGSGADIQGAAKTVATSRASTITNTDDPDLAGFGLEPSATYIVEIGLIFRGNGATANGFRWALDFNGQIGNVTALQGPGFSTLTGVASGGTIVTSTIHSAFSQIKTTFDSGGTDEVVWARFAVVTGASYVAGTAVDLQWAQGTSDATNTTLEDGSSMTVYRIA